MYTWKLFRMAVKRQKAENMKDVLKETYSKERSLTFELEFLETREWQGEKIFWERMAEKFLATVINVNIQVRVLSGFQTSLFGIFVRLSLSKNWHISFKL